MNSFLIFFLVFFIVYGLVYGVFYMFFHSAVKREEGALIDIFLHKISKIPALIEVMRPFIVKKEAFDTLTAIHTETIIEATESIYDILTHNARLQNEFLFLMELSHHAPKLQKHEYFLYIRDFIIGYERSMRESFPRMNQSIRRWNLFIQIINFTIIGFFLPGRERSEIV